MPISFRITRTLERNSSADPNCCPWRWFLKCANKKKSEGAKPGEYDEGGATRKKLSSPDALVIFASCGLALSACMINLLSPLSTPSNDIRATISDIVGSREHPSFSYGINDLASIGIPDEC
jgi:hypothetical protein